MNDFKELISDQKRFDEIMEKNCSSGSSYKEWEDKRKFIAEAINSDGTILDIGCAGGFFLKSLQEWSDHKLMPYGIDVEGDFIEEAKSLFSEQKDHFAKMDVKDIRELPSIGFPGQYDFVYLSLPGNIADTEWRDLLKNVIMPMATKRLVIGFYGENRFPFDSDGWKKERERIKERVKEFEDADIGITGSAFNPTKFNQAIAWIDR
jgi:SAM-dependent methyltransferase